MANAHQSFGSRVYSHAKPMASRDWIDKKTHILIDTVEALDDAVALIGPEVSVDTETSGLHYAKDQIAGYSFSPDGQVGFYVPINHARGKNIPEEIAVGKLAEASKGAKIYTYNKRFDASILKKYGYDMWKDAVLLDAAVLAYLYDANLHSPSLKEMATYALGYEMISFEEAIGAKPGTILATSLDSSQIYVYASCDAIATFELYKRLEVVISQWGLDPLSRLDEQLIEVLHSMEHTAIPIDADHVEVIKEELLEKKEEAEASLYTLAGKTFAINSGPQLSTVLQNAGVPLTTRTKTGKLATGADVLKIFSDDYPIVKAVEDYRKYSKLKNFADMLSGAYEWEDMSPWWHENIKTHTKTQPFVIVGYNPYNVPTGRLSCRGKDTKGKDTIFSGVNIQQIPKPKTIDGRLVARDDKLDDDELSTVSDTDRLRICYGVCGMNNSGHCKHGDGSTQCARQIKDLEIPDPKLNFRSVFVPYDGHLYLHADYASQEVMIPTFYSQEPVWLDAIMNDRDIHRSTAASLFKVPYESVTADQRAMAKSLTFGLLYGSGPYGISRSQGIPLDEAMYLYDQYHNNLPVLSAFLKSLEEKMHKSGYVDTIFGRRRYMTPWLQSGNKADRGYAARTSSNHINQGSGADLMRIALSRFYINKDKEPWNFGDNLYLLSTVHDEINCSVHPDHLGKAIAFMQQCMVFPLPKLDPKYLLRADFGFGPNWGTLVEMSTSEVIPIFKEYKIEHFMRTAKVNRILEELVSVA